MGAVDTLRSLLPARYLADDAAIDGTPLSVLLTLIGEPLDQIIAAIDAMPTLADIETCPEEFLPLLGELIGYAYDYAQPLVFHRRAIRDTIHRYRRTGSVAFLMAELRTLGWVGDIREHHQAVLRANRRCTLNHGRASGRIYAYGVYTVTRVPFDVRALHAIRANHPAGTRVLVEIEPVATLTTLRGDESSVRSGWTVTVDGLTSDRAFLNHSRLNQSPLGRGLRTRSHLVVVPA